MLLLNQEILKLKDSIKIVDLKPYQIKYGIINGCSKKNGLKFWNKAKIIPGGNSLISKDLKDTP